MSDIRVIVGLDFGTTYSGFTYCHVDGSVSAEGYVTNAEWPGDRGTGYKTNTVLQYEANLTDVKSWGYPALAKRPRRGFNRNKQDCVVELFKLQLGNLNRELRNRIAPVVDYKKAITDYLREIGKLIRERVTNAWRDIEFYEHVLLVLTVPAEYGESAKAIMRDCAYKAELINDLDSRKLQFTTEPEAAAVFCMKTCLREYDLAVGATFMIVDSGGGTVDLTMSKLLNENQLGEVSERTGDYCGSAFIDNKFVEHLTTELGEEAMNFLRKNYYGQLQYLVQEFCQHVKFPFTGEDTSFAYEMDLEVVSHILLQRLDEEQRRRMEEANWLIKLDYETIKKMFDVVIDRIIGLIKLQLENCKENSKEECSAMFLVGGFSQSEYLQRRIKREFEGQRIHVPTVPIAAVSRGAAIYGLSFRNLDDVGEDDDYMFVIDSRILRFTYGIKIYSPWVEGDPPERRNEKFRFHIIGGKEETDMKAKRGTSVRTNEGISVGTRPTIPNQTKGEYEIFYTRNYEAKYCDEDGVRLLGKLIINWPDAHLGLNRPTIFTLTFGRMEITASARNQTNGQSYQTSLSLEQEEEE